MNEVIKAMVERRSTRKYKPDMVPDELINQVVEAGLYAPSGMGKQDPIILVIKDRETRDKIAAMNAAIAKRAGDTFYGAPVILAVLVPSDWFTGVEDGSLAIGNMLLAAHSLGLGCCWIHRAMQEFESEEGKALLRKIGVEGDYRGVGHVALGFPDAEPGKPASRRAGRVFTI